MRSKNPTKNHAEIQAKNQSNKAPHGPRSKLLCFGGAHLDIKIQALGKIIAKSSNPVQTTRHWGGVARNIAETLARLDVPVGLCTRLGRDALGVEVLKNITENRIDSSLVTYSDELPTATYTAFLSSSGQLELAAADMMIYDELTPGTVVDFLEVVTEAALWVLDTNLPERTIHFLAAEKPESVALWAVPTSEAKAERLKGSLARIEGLILNRAELQALSGKSDLKAGCEKLLEWGAKSILVTQGEEGVQLACASGLTCFTVPKVKSPKEVTGAGDAFAAGVLYGVYTGKALSESVVYGLASARMALMTQETVNPTLSVTRLGKELEIMRSAGA